MNFFGSKADLTGNPPKLIPLFGHPEMLELLWSSLEAASEGDSYSHSLATAASSGRHQPQEGGRWASTLGARVLASEMDALDCLCESSYLPAPMLTGSQPNPHPACALGPGSQIPRQVFLYHRGQPSPGSLGLHVPSGPTACSLPGWSSAGVWKCMGRFVSAPGWSPALEPQSHPHPQNAQKGKRACIYLCLF